ncbi:MAG: hypothetical protein AAF517_19295, partial [Planctomycetota bacterium]
WFSDVLAFMGAILFAPLQINIRFELLFVMIFFPGFLNVIYFWIADSYLKAGDEHEGAFEEATGKQEQLMTADEKAAAKQAAELRKKLTERWKKIAGFAELKAKRASDVEASKTAVETANKAFETAVKAYEEARLRLLGKSS